jgi:hypothetical protein
MLGALFEIYKLSGILGAGIFDLHRENVLKAWSWAIAPARAFGEIAAVDGETEVLNGFGAAQLHLGWGEAGC